MDMKFKTTKEYKKLKKEFIIMNFVFVFIYFAFYKFSCVSLCFYFKYK
ncbi:hypothetical protein M1770_09910 [Spiroplasma citri]|nr:hypothetical protein [Spiroplasma citri]WFG98331.1 hypothetical protein M1770_09910 [Spiroplasma citri]